MSASSGRTAMVDATWKSVEAVGIPDSPVRRMLFQLAQLTDDHVVGRDDLALLSAAYRALTHVLHERANDDRKSPLQVQVDVQRDTREMRAMGVDVPDISFTDEDFALPPTTPVELATQLGYADRGRAVRRVLRQGFPDHEKNGRWEPLTSAQVSYVRAHLRSRR